MREWKQRTSAFSSFVCDAACVAFAEKVEVEGCGNEEHQPLVAQCTILPAVPLRKRLRLRELKRRTSAFSSFVCDAACVSFAEKVEA